MYGNSIASYPVKIVEPSTNASNIMFTNVASGQIYNGALKLSVVDYDNQVSFFTEGGTISINPIKPGSNVLGRNTESIVNGTATFTGLIFIAEPGSESVEFEVTSSAIDKDKLLKQFGK